MSSAPPPTAVPIDDGRTYGLDDCLKDPTVGMLVIFRASVASSKIFLPLKLLPLLVTTVQITVSLMIFLYYFQLYDVGWCPDSAAPAYPRLMMSMVALLTFIRLYMNANDLYESLLSSDFVGDLRWRPSALAAYSLIDSFFLRGCFEPLVYLLNLWLVFQIDSPLDMLLNSLALEFLIKLDDDFKDRFVRSHPSILKNIKTFHDGGAIDNRGCIGRTVSLLLTSAYLLLFALMTFTGGAAILIALATIVAGPMCKPFGLDYIN